MEKQLVVFELDHQFYGLDIASVESIIKMQAITLVPNAPQFVLGVTNLRGNILPVVDLHRRFGLAETEPTEASRIIVVTFYGSAAGMLVDGVSEVLTVQEEAIEPPPPMASTIDSSFITGIVKLENRLVILLDLGESLSVKGMHAG